MIDVQGRFLHRCHYDRKSHDVSLTHLVPLSSSGTCHFMSCQPPAAVMLAAVPCGNGYSILAASSVDEPAAVLCGRVPWLQAGSQTHSGMACHPAPPAPAQADAAARGAACTPATCTCAGGGTYAAASASRFRHDRLTRQRPRLQPVHHHQGAAGEASGAHAATCEWPCVTSELACHTAIDSNGENAAVRVWLCVMNKLHGCTMSHVSHSNELRGEYATMREFLCVTNELHGCTVPHVSHSNELKW